MSRVKDALSLFFREQKPIVDGGMHLVSFLSARCANGQVELAWPGIVVPSDAQDLWGACCGARLFADVSYGQWGLVLLDPFSSAARTAQEKGIRPAEYRPDDMIVGEFLGDSDVVVLCPSEAGSRRVLIAPPLDPRDTWFAVGPELADLITAFHDSNGEKFWVRPSAQMS
ncbi:MAG: hypothetical protein K8M05_17180 [Deltaproteobacteria bacterium]|nr:hypothetical protein [Kofleriaceae bacterium]